MVLFCLLYIFLVILLYINRIIYYILFSLLLLFFKWDMSKYSVYILFTN